MIKYNLRKSIVTYVLLLTTIIIFGCSDEDNPIDAGNNNNSAAVIEGRVTGTSGFSKTNTLMKTNGIEGATVTVAKVQSNGSLSTVSNASVMTNAEGNFTVETNSLNEQDLIIVAQKGQAEWKAVVSATTTAESKIYCPPVNDETDVEAEVYAKLKAEGNTEVSYSDVQYYIDSKVAAEIKGNTTAIAEVAASLSAEAEAKSKAFAEAYFDASVATMQTINSAKAEAQADFEAALYFAGENQNAYDVAFEAYQEAVLNAYLNAGLEKSEYAKIIEISSDEMVRASTSLDSEAEFALRKSSAKRKAYACREAQEAECDSVGADANEKNSVISAGVDLEASIETAQTASEIEAAFEAYHNTVIEQLKVTLEAEASIITAIDSTINSSGGLKAVLETSLSAAVTSDAVINAYVAFYENVKSLVEAQMQTASSAEINAAAEIFVLANS